MEPDSSKNGTVLSNLYLAKQAVKEPISKYETEYFNKMYKDNATLLKIK